MNEEEIKKQLILDGFRDIFEHTDPPGAYYPDHTHSTATCHFVLEGEITVTSKGVTRTYTKGERFDVDPGEVHSAKVGDSGCRYLIGEK